MRKTENYIEPEIKFSICMEEEETDKVAYNLHEQRRGYPNSKVVGYTASVDFMKKYGTPLQLLFLKVESLEELVSFLTELRVNWSTKLRELEELVNAGH